MYNIGLCSVSFRNKTPEDIFVACREAGVSFIEWGSDIHAPHKEYHKINNIVRLSEKYNIQCSSYGTYFRVGKDDPNELVSYIEAASALGTNILRIWCGIKGSNEYIKSEKNNIYELCKRIADIAEKNNVVLCSECHIWTYTDEVNSALELMKSVNSPFFKMYWQPNQFKSFEENINYASLISNYIVNVHVFNWEGTTKHPLSMGYDSWYRYLEKIGDDKTLLLEFMPDDRIESLSVEADSLRKIIGEEKQ